VVWGYTAIPLGDQIGIVAGKKSVGWLWFELGCISLTESLSATVVMRRITTFSFQPQIFSPFFGE
jgi:hypothetical protein